MVKSNISSHLLFLLSWQRCPRLLRSLRFTSNYWIYLLSMFVRHYHRSLRTWAYCPPWREEYKGQVLDSTNMTMGSHSNWANHLSWCRRTVEALSPNRGKSMPAHFLIPFPIQDLAHMHQDSTRFFHLIATTLSPNQKGNLPAIRARLVRDIFLEPTPEI